MSAWTAKNLKLLTAAAGIGAVLTLGIAGAATDPHPAAVPALTGSQMNIGQTSTQTTPPATPVISKAEPAIKGPAALPSEQADAE